MIAGVLAGALLACLGFLSVARSAPAATITDRPLLFSFDGSDSAIGAFTRLQDIAVDESTGSVYVLNVPDGGPLDQGGVCKFNADGEAQEFAAAGSSCLDDSETPGGGFGVEGEFGNYARLAVDNSAANPGRLYVLEGNGPLHAFDSNGAYLWSLPREGAGGVPLAKDACSVAVGPDGHLWFGVRGSPDEVLEFDSVGSPPAQLGSFDVAGGGDPCALDLDDSGQDLYVGSFSGFRRYDALSGVLEANLVEGSPSPSIAVDQSSPAGHVFALQGSPAHRFVEFDSADAEVDSFDGGGAIGGGRGIAHNAALDRVYVAGFEFLSGGALAVGSVKAFGPRTTGTVPDVEIDPTTAVGGVGATANGTINPRNLTHSYSFQWKRIAAWRLTVDASGGEFVFRVSGGGPVTPFLPFDVSPAALQAALEGYFGPGSISVTGTPADGAGTPGSYDIVAAGELAEGPVETSGLNLAPGDSFGGEGLSPLGSKLAFSEINAGERWSTAREQPLPHPSIEPSDNAGHPVSFAITGLKGGTTYQVRLVGTNGENSLRSYSEPDTFTTTIAPPPQVSVQELSFDGATAHVEATIDPQEDETTWRFRAGLGAGCTAPFIDRPLQTIPAGAPNSIEVEADLAFPAEFPGGALPAQSYCVQAVATNSGGTVSAYRTFRTEAVPPSGAEAAFVAPRTDTAARINARVNPEGEADLSYRFEFRSDGGEWEQLPMRTGTVDARGPIVVSEELTGLQPGATYHYRLEMVENEAGPAPSLGGERSFTTRPTPSDPSCPNAGVRAAQHSVYLPDCRAFELINDPEKGNQDAYPGTFGEGLAIGADGERAMWHVEGAAPIGNTTEINVFWADRTPSGWASSPLAPPPSQQLGPEYTALAATPDLSTVIARARRIGHAATLVRLDRNGNQEPLREYPGSFGIFGDGADAEISADGSSVLARNPETEQLEDIGSGEPAEEVSIQPDGKASKCGALFTPDPGYRWSAVDASRVYFVAPPNNSCAAPSALWVRNREAAGEAGETTLVDPGVSAPRSEPEMIRTAPDGRTAYFVTRSALDPADENEDADLYRWDEANGESSCLTCAAHPDASIVMSGATKVLLSDDLSHAYFESSAQLSPEATAGHRTIYALSGGEIRFVADANVGEAGALARDAEVSADGRVLVFRAPASAGLTSDPVAAGLEEIYRYEEGEGSLECISCRAGGVTTGGGFDPALSADGNTAAFHSDEALVGADVNASPDIYRWRDGTVRLVSDGVSDYPQVPDVVGLDASGEDLFVRLVSPGLTGFEYDGLASLYDARIDGGFEVPSPIVHCAGDSCQGPLAPAPDSRPLASAGFSGRGNLPAAARRRCRGSKLRRGRRCLTKRAQARACRRKRGQAKRRCVRRQLRRINQAHQRRRGR